MSHHVYVRPARSGEGALFEQWSQGTENNLFDPQAALYPTSFTLCAYDSSGPLVFMPIQQPLFLESLAIRPETDRLPIAKAMKELIHTAVTQAHLKGAGEIYFMCKDESTIAYAAQSFEELPYRLFRLRLSDTEGPK